MEFQVVIGKNIIYLNLVLEKKRYPFLKLCKWAIYWGCIIVTESITVKTQLFIIVKTKKIKYNCCSKSSNIKKKKLTVYYV